MPSPTYVAIAKTVLTSSSASVVFASIPSTYTDLYLVWSARMDATNATTYVLFNSETTSTTSNSLTRLYAYNGSVYSARESNYPIYYYLSINESDSTSNTFSNSDLYIANYAGSTNKPMSGTSVIETNTAASFDAAIQPLAGLRSNTTSISRIEFVPALGNFVSGSRFDLYGIKSSS